MADLYALPSTKPQMTPEEQADLELEAIEDLDARMADYLERLPGDSTIGKYLVGDRGRLGLLRHMSTLRAALRRAKRGEGGPTWPA